MRIDLLISLISSHAIKFSERLLASHFTRYTTVVQGDLVNTNWL